MFSWNYQGQVADMWGGNQGIEDYIASVSKDHEGKSFSKYEKHRKKQKKEENNTAESSGRGTFESENNFHISTMVKNSGINTNEDLDDAGMDMDAWPDLPNIRMAFCGGDGNDRDSFQTGLESKLADATVPKYTGVLMAGDRGSPLSKPCIPLSGNGMQLDAEPDHFGLGDKGNDSFVVYDWYTIEDFDDLDKLFSNSEEIFEVGTIQRADPFLASSSDVINNNTSQSIPVPELALCMNHELDKGSSSHLLAKYSGINNSEKEKAAKATLQNKKEQTTSHTYLSSESCGKHSITSLKADRQNLAPFAMKKDEKAVGEICKDQHGSWSNKFQKISSYTKQPSATNPSQIIQSQFIEQLGSSHQFMMAQYGHPAYQLRSPQQHNFAPSAFSTNLDCLKHPKPAEPSPKQISMTPREKIEKLKRRQQMQAMVAIQKQREQYNHHPAAKHTSPHACWQTPHNQGITNSTISMEEYGQNLPSSKTTSSLIDDCFIEENIYYRLKVATEKLDMRVRLSIRDSLYRLARSSKDRQNADDRSSTNISNMEKDEISANEESNQHARCPTMHISEAITNPIDRVVAHLLFHNPSGPLKQAADGNMLTGNFA